MGGLLAPSTQLTNGGNKSEPTHPNPSWLEFSPTLFSLLLASKLSNSHSQPSIQTFILSGINIFCVPNDGLEPGDEPITRFTPSFEGLPWEPFMLSPSFRPLPFRNGNGCRVSSTKWKQNLWGWGPGIGSFNFSLGQSSKVQLGGSHGAQFYLIYLLAPSLLLQRARVRVTQHFHICYLCKKETKAASQQVSGV